MLRDAAYQELMKYTPLTVLCRWLWLSDKLPEVCAALAARSGVTIREVPYRDVREELLGQGAILEI